MEKMSSCAMRTKRKMANALKEIMKTTSFEKITVSGGVCGLSIMLSPHDLIKITGAASADIIKESN